MRHALALILLAALPVAGQIPAIPSAPSKKAPAPARPSAHVSAEPSYKNLVYPPAKPIPAPAVESMTLPNGMRLLLLEDHELPVVNGVVRIRTGSVFDPPDKIGLAALTGTVLRTGGTAKRTGDEVDRVLEDLAASIESNIGEEVGSIAFSALTEDIAPVLDSLHDIMTAPEFRQDKIDLAKTQLHGAVARRNDNLSAIAPREFASLLYGPRKPYGWKMEHATIDAITRADIEGFYHRYYFPANVRVALWGDFDTASMKARIEKLFADWTAKQEAVGEFPPAPSRSAPATYLAANREGTQTFFSMGHLGGLIKDKDYAALNIMVNILGGGPQSRLYQLSRSRMNNAFVAVASYEAGYDHPGVLQIAGNTRSFSTMETIRSVQREIERMRTTEVGEDELKAAKDTILNGLVFAFDTRAKYLSRLLAYDYYGYPTDFVQQYQKAVESVTRADVLRVAREQLDPETFTLLAVGNPEGFDEPLEKLGRPVLPVDLRIPPPGLVPGSSTATSKAVEILTHAQQVAGGVDRLSSVKDWEQNAEFALDPAIGGLHVKERVRWIGPEYFRQDSETPSGKISAWYDGSKGWIVTPQGGSALTGAQLKQVQGDLFRMYIRLLLSDRLPGRSVSATSDGGIDITSDKGDSAHAIFSATTGFLRFVSYESANAAGPPFKVEESFSDFHDVNGIMVPFKVEITQNDASFAVVTLTNVKYNSGFKVADLELKTGSEARK